VATRVLVTIPHYARPGGPADGREHGSVTADPDARRRALTACLTGLHRLFNAPPWFIHHGCGRAHPAGPAVSYALDVVLCTTGGQHLLDSLPVAPNYYTHLATDVEPLLLGFACHDVLRERLGDYDYYCYLEDDLILHDPSFLVKLAWFNRGVGDDKLLQPNRYEAGLNHLVPRVYVDGDLDPAVTAPFQNVADSDLVAAEAFGVGVLFERTLNPHSGCFFLNARQMTHWAGQPHFGDRAAGFIGPLESAATLGILRTFKVYRPAPANADFLEIEHAGTGYLERLRPGAGWGPP
jgi:hypothetical protein